jgi:hypothetical protein
VASAASIATDFRCSRTLVVPPRQGLHQVKDQSLASPLFRVGTGLLAWPWCGAHSDTAATCQTAQDLSSRGAAVNLVRRGAWRMTAWTGTSQWRDCFCQFYSWCSLEAACRSLRQLSASAPQADGRAQGLFLIADGRLSHRAKTVQKFVKANGALLQLYFLRPIGTRTQSRRATQS